MGRLLADLGEVSARDVAKHARDAAAAGKVRVLFLFSRHKRFLMSMDSRSRATGMLRVEALVAQISSIMLCEELWGLPPGLACMLRQQRTLLHCYPSLPC